MLQLKRTNSILIGPVNDYEILMHWKFLGSIVIALICNPGHQGWQPGSSLAVSILSAYLCGS